MFVRASSPGIKTILDDLKRLGLEHDFKVQAVLGRFDYVIRFDHEFPSDDFKEMIREINKITGVARTETLLSVDL